MPKTNEQLIQETLNDLFPITRREPQTTFLKRAAAQAAMERLVEKQLDNHFQKTPSENLTSKPNKVFCDAPGCF